MTKRQYKKRPKDHLLPGDVSGEKLTQRIVRVDHAGEFGAKRIYEGQLKFVRSEKSKKLIEEMYAQELEHLEKFEQFINETGAKPTVMMPIWNACGYALGAATAMMGDEAAMACTAAVEDVIDGHYEKQLSLLSGQKPVASGQQILSDAIEKFRQDEIHHKETALAADAEEAPLYPVLSGVIKAISRTAIWISERV